MEYNCQFCGRDARLVGKQHYRNDADGKVVCEDCGVNNTPPPNQPSLGTPSPADDTNMRYVSLEGFLNTLPEICKERINQIIKYGYSAQHDTHHSLGDFLLYMDKYLRRAQAKYASHNPQQAANARSEVVKVIALGMAYLESHPLPNE